MSKLGIPSIIGAICLLIAIPTVGQQPATSPAGLAKDAGLRLLAPRHDLVSMTAADLKSISHLSVTIHNSHSNADETYTGVRVSDLLPKVGATLGNNLRGKALAQYIVASGSDGYQTVLSIGEVDPDFHPGEIIVADAMDGKPLDARSGPFKLVVTEDKHPARSVRNLVQIELKTVE